MEGDGVSGKLGGEVYEYEFKHGEQAVLLAMADHAQDDGSDCYPSIGRVAWKIGYGERQVKRVIKDLRKRNILIEVAPPRQHRPTEYRINLSAATPKSPFKSRGDICDTDDSRGDICDSPGVTSDASRGDIAMSPEPSNETSGGTEQQTSPGKEASPPSAGRDEPSNSEGKQSIVNVPTGGRLSNLLADLIATNDPDGVRPTISKEWLDAERLLVTKDGRDPQMAAHLIRWCQADGFWRGNIKSMPKFRAKYSTLWDHSRRSSRTTGSSAASDRIQERLRGAG
jgi:hypothetical protein